jgi:hypothetical protein
VGTTYTLSGDTGTLIPDALLKSTHARVETNLPRGTALIDKTADAGGIKLGGGKIDVAADGTFTVPLLGTANTGLNIPANELRYQVVIEYTDAGTRAAMVWRSGWFELTADADLKVIAPEVEPLAVSSASTFAQEAAASAALARSIAEIDTTDAAIKTTLELPESESGTYLAATFVRALHVQPGKKGVLGNGSGDDTAAIQAILDQVSPALGVTDVVVHSGTYMIDGVNEAQTPTRNRWMGGGLKPKSGTNLILAPDATLRIITNSSPGYAAIYLGRLIDDVRIIGGRIEGDRATHDYATEPTYTTHEYGFGIAVHGARDILVQGVTITGMAGDGIFAISDGFATSPATYYPAKRLTIRDCYISGSRRNNISLCAFDTALIENCTIADAGTNDGIKDGIAPKLGIDIEGYSEPGIEYEVPTRATVRGCKFVGNVTGAVMNYNGHNIVIEGNYADSLISYGFGTETVIRGNVVVNLANTTQDGIGCNYATGYAEANCVIANNIVRGFANGIKAQREGVTVVGNYVSEFVNAGITFNSATNGLADGNHVSDGSGASAVGFLISSSTRVKLTGNAVNNTRTGVRVDVTSTGVVVDSNTITKGYQALSVTAGCSVHFKGNTVDLAGHSAGVTSNLTWSGTSVVTCEGNVIRNPGARSIDVTNTAGTGTSRIIGNTFEGVNASSILLSGGKHELIRNTFIGGLASGSYVTGVVTLSGTQDKTLIVGNVVYNAGSVAFGVMVYTNASAANTRLIKNVHVGTAILGGTPAGTEVQTDNDVVTP